MNIEAERISSKQNPKIKNLVHLQKHSERVEQNLFLVEGLKEIEKAIKSGYEVDSLYFCPEIVDIDEIHRIFKAEIPQLIFEINSEIFNKVAYRKDSGGLILVARPGDHCLSNLKIEQNPLILVIEGVEKPGNIGAICRTADAAGVSAIIICDPGTDLYNPNAIRSSLGCVFSIQTAIATSKETISWLKDQKIQILASYLQAAIPYHKANFTKPTAIVMGTEATGISDIWLKSSDTKIIIPMRGMADSMNVSTATAVLLFEACRQRNFI